VRRVYQNKSTACIPFACDKSRRDPRARDVGARQEDFRRRCSKPESGCPRSASPRTITPIGCVLPGFAEMKKNVFRVHTFYRPRNWGDGSEEPSWGSRRRPRHFQLSSPREAKELRRSRCVSERAVFTSPRPACGRGRNRIEDAIRVRGTSFRIELSHPPRDPLPQPASPANRGEGEDRLTPRYPARSRIRCRMASVRRMRRSRRRSLRLPGIDSSVTPPDASSATAALAESHLRNVAISCCRAARPRRVRV